MQSAVVPHAHAACVLRQHASATEAQSFSSSSLVCVRGKAPGLRCRGARQEVELGNFSSELRRFGIQHRVCPRASSWRIFAQQGAATTLKWVLDPVGDGDSKHLDSKVPLPSSFELVSDSTTVGRGEGKVDVVLDVATVSGLHARLDKRGSDLYVTDMGSTNGTYVNKKRLRAGVDTPAPPGSIITFGDEHLAVFRFSQVPLAVQNGEANPEVQKAVEANPES